MPDYRLEVKYADGDLHVVDDPYRFLPTLGEMDLHLIGEGRHEQLWHVLGAHVHRSSPFGPSPARRSPSGRRTPRGVRVVGDFNDWDGRAHPMRSSGASGVWELFVPGIGAGTRYKYDMLRRRRRWREKADPHGRAHRGAARDRVRRPRVALRLGRRRVDGAPGEQRPARAADVRLRGAPGLVAPRTARYRELADELVDYVKRRWASPTSS